LIRRLGTTLNTLLRISRLKIEETFMKISKFKKSNFITKDDVDPEVTATISEVLEENVAKEGMPPDFKAVAHFAELDKGLVLNWTNLQIIAQAMGSEDTDDWPGGKIVLWFDPSVAFQGKLVGGIRVRPVRNIAA
jgi:hypothetical protein